MTDRTRGYIPRPTYEGDEVRPSTTIEIGHDDNRRHLPLALGMADELNETQSWWWARLDQDGEEHWIHAARGHRVQVEIKFCTENRREVNDWKGRDEVRPEGDWLIKLNREPAWGGYIHDVFWTLETIKRKLEWLLGDGCPISWHTGQRYPDLHGRRIYYRDQPATIVSSIAEQGCVMIRAVDPRGFTSPVWSDEPDGYHDAEDVKTEIDSSHIWWWRDDNEASTVEPVRPEPSRG